MPVEVKKRFVAMILTHKRAGNVKTLEVLRDHGYTGEVRLVVDDEDPMLEEYRNLYGDMVWEFSKAKLEGKFDACDNFGNRCSITYPRNAAFDLAEENGVDYFIELDDDYRAFTWNFDSSLNYSVRPVGCLDKVFEAMVKFLENTPTTSIATAQSGDFMGGDMGQFARSVWAKRKAMNSFICSTKKRFEFRGKINEDVNAYVGDGNLGALFFTINLVCLYQGATQQTEGGLTELYLDVGTYVKSFYTVMIAPSCVKVALMGAGHKRLHHKVDWKYAVPKILPESLKKSS